MEAENEVYQKERLLGEGAFGKAYLVRGKQTGELLVIKEVSIEHMSQKEQEETIKEAQILRNFKHPLIVRFIEVYATKHNKLKIVMEYAECGDLSKAIAAKRAEKRQFEEAQVLDWFTQICLAMKHVHDRKILHRDIKGQNIFITKANTLKLGDFGIARVLNRTQDKARTVVGTPYYLSPEIIENKPYSFKSDIWSMGVLLYELCALAPPFNANSLQLLALKIVKGSYTPLTAAYSKELKGLIGDILQVDPNRRPPLKDILDRPFIKERIQKFLSETSHKIEFSHTILHNHVQPILYLEGRDIQQTGEGAGRKEAGEGAGAAGGEETDEGAGGEEAGRGAQQAQGGGSPAQGEDGAQEGGGAAEGRGEAAEEEGGRAAAGGGGAEAEGTRAEAGGRGAQALDRKGEEEGGREPAQLPGTVT